MSVPVPLTDLLAKADDQADDLGIVILYPEQVRALCEALRIAVEGLATVQNGQRCEKVVATAPETSTCPHQERMTRDAYYGDDRWCDKCIARSALAAVRELVDLGGDDG